MIQTLSQFDEFAPDAREIREAVIAGGFETVKGPDGLEYTGISKHEVPHWHVLLGEALGAPIIPRLSCFRLNLAGEKPHSWIHSDDICGRYASVLYLNPPPQCFGGTAFWRHTGLGIDTMPTAEYIQASGFGVAWFLDMLRREWNDLTYWEQCGFVGMQWNRLIVYPSSRFHSRYPFEPFGDGAADGRLIWICHFDIGEVSEAVT